MYGGSFKQNFGWYVSKQLLQFGIHPFTFPILPDSCPQELLALAVLDPREAYARRLTLLESDRDKADELSKKLERQHRAIWNFAENEVRLKFGHKKIGDAWTSETILYSIVRSLFPDAQVLRHYRPTFLEGLEIDIFVTDPVIGIEYQGIQHFRPVAHWGGKDALVQLRERDKRKAAICHAEGIPLVHFNYDEPLSKDFVSDRLNKILDTHS